MFVIHRKSPQQSNLLLLTVCCCTFPHYIEWRHVKNWFTLRVPLWKQVSGMAVAYIIHICFFGRIQHIHTLTSPVGATDTIKRDSRYCFFAPVYFMNINVCFLYTLLGLWGCSLHAQNGRRCAARPPPPISIKVPSPRLMINIEKIRVKTSLEKYANQWSIVRPTQSR